MKQPQKVWHPVVVLLEKKRRSQAVQDATQYATEIPLQVMETAFNSIEVMAEMIDKGLQNSLSDAGVGVLCAKTAVVGAYFNVKINAKDLKDKEVAARLLDKAKTIYDETMAVEEKLTKIVFDKLS